MRNVTKDAAGTARAAEVSPMQGIAQLFEWWNAIFSVPLGIATLYLLVTTFLGLEHGGAGGEHDLDHDVDHGVEHDVDQDADAEAEAESDADGPLSHAAETPTPVDDLLVFLGAQQVSLTLVLELFCIGWGVFGLITNSVLEPLLRQPLLFIWPAVAVALVGSTLLTRGTARLVARYLPREQTAALSRRELEGLVGRVVYSVDQRSGLVHVRDRYGALHQLAGRTETGTIPHGDQVLVVEYVSDGDFYRVEPAPDDLADEAPVRLSGTTKSDTEQAAAERRD